MEVRTDERPDRAWLERQVRRRQSVYLRDDAREKLLRLLEHNMKLSRLSDGGYFVTVDNLNSFLVSAIEAEFERTFGKTQ